MSNIEPTVTRTMRCTTCSVVGTHTIDASMRNEAVLCPACAESGKRSACVVVAPIEPTEEHYDAVCRFLSKEIDNGDNVRVEALARLLAEREAKLRGEHQVIIATMRRGADELIADNDTLRARVVDLEAKQARLKHLANDEVAACGAHIDSLEKLLKAATAREAQHLADIKAAKQELHRKNQHLPEVATDELLARLAHYDNAKAAAPAGPVTGIPATEEERCTRCLEPYSRDNWCAENGHDVPREALGEPDVDPSQDVTFPAVCPKCDEGTHPFFDVEQNRWLCDRCHHPAGEPFVHDADTEGGEG